MLPSMLSPHTLPPLFSITNARLALNTPWKVRNEVSRLALLPWARATFLLLGLPWPTGIKLYGMPIIQKYRPSTLIIGAHAELRSTPRSNALSPSHPVVLTTRREGATLIIGHHFGMTGGTICAEQRVTIGNHVTIGANTIITDTDFHPLQPAKRRRSPSAGNTEPVHIADDVFVGTQCIILKGISIGKGSVIGAGSVVTKDIPAGVVAAGNPARVLKKLLR